MTQSEKPPGKQTHNPIRVDNNLMIRVEKKLLLWLAARMPGWVTPDKLTTFGFLGSILIFISYTLTIFSPVFLWLASLGFIINWFGDSLDGTLARFRKIERPRYGFFIDHIIDSVSEVLVFIGLGISPYLRFELALLALVSYLLASIYVYLATYVDGIFRISFSGVNPTTLRLLAIAANTAVFFTGNPVIPIPPNPLVPTSFFLTLFDLVILAVTLVIMVLFLVNTYATARNLSDEDNALRRKKTKKHLKKMAAPADRMDEGETPVQVDALPVKPDPGQ